MLGRIYTYPNRLGAEVGSVSSRRDADFHPSESWCRGSLSWCIIPSLWRQVAPSRFLAG